MKRVKRSFVLSAVPVARALTGGSLVAQEQPAPGKIATQMKENQFDYSGVSLYGKFFF